MLYTVIPNLVSLDAPSPRIPDFLLSQDLRFYKNPSHPLPYHYTIRFRHAPFVPSEKTYVNGDYFRTGGAYHYVRTLFPHIGFSFMYDPERKIFTFNDAYRLHMVNIGGIFTAGRHLFHMIEFDLLANGIFILLGAAVRTPTKKTVMVLSPFNTGKTTFVGRALSNGSSYIAENFCVVDVTRGYVHGTAPLFSNKGRKTNALLRDIFATGNPAVEPGGTVTSVYLQGKSTDVSVSQYISTFGGYFMKNNLIRTYLYYSGKDMDIRTLYLPLERFLKRKGVHHVHSLRSIRL